eukprot:1168324-Pyramimonas_sp.AAC.1
MSRHSQGTVTQDVTLTTQGLTKRNVREMMPRLQGSYAITEPYVTEFLCGLQQSAYVRGWGFESHPRCLKQGVVRRHGMG